ncbi:hypothetical protein ACB092_10G209600 [Castanea dentata]
MVIGIYVPFLNTSQEKYIQIFKLLTHTDKMKKNMGWREKNHQC